MCSSVNCKSLYHKRLFSEQCIYQNYLLYLKNNDTENEKNYKFLNLFGLSTESFLEIWLSQYKFLSNEFLMKKNVYTQSDGAALRMRKNSIFLQRT